MSVSLYGSGQTVIQVASASSSGAFSVSATYGSWYDVTGLSVTITPQSTTSKILVIADINAYNSGVFALLQIARNGTAIYQGSGGSTSNALIMPYPIYTYGPWGFRTAVYLDSPATTSATTYKIQASVNSGTGTVYVNNRGDGTLAVPSSITVLEISGS